MKRTCVVCYYYYYHHICDLTDKICLKSNWTLGINHENRLRWIHQECTYISTHPSLMFRFTYMPHAGIIRKRTSAPLKIPSRSIWMECKSHPSSMSLVLELIRIHGCWCVENKLSPLPPCRTPYRWYANANPEVDHNSSTALLNRAFPMFCSELCSHTCLMSG